MGELSGGAGAVRSVPRAAPPGHCLAEGAAAAELPRVTWCVARGSRAGSLGHILQWDPALLLPP